MVIKEQVDVLTDNVKDYVNTQYELLVLQASEKVSLGISETISGLVIGVVSFVALLFLSVSLAFYLSSVNGNAYFGFLVVGGVYLMAGIIVLIFRKKLLSIPLQDKIIQGFFKEN